MMQQARKGRRWLLQMLSLHVYCSMKVDGEAAWGVVLGKARRFATVLARHCAVMDAHDPERQVGLAVDEWGCWSAPEPATSPAAAAAVEGAAGTAASDAAAAAAVAAGGPAPAP